MNLTTLLAKLRRKVGNPTTADIPDADLTDYLNEAYRDIVDRFRFHATEVTSTIPTVNGTATYNVPTTSLVLKSVYDQTNNVRLQRRDQDYFDRLGTVSNSKPTSYLRFAGTLQLTPVPDAVYTLQLRFLQPVTDLTGGSDVPVIPVYWHDGILLLSRYKFYDEKQDAARMALTFRSWSQWVASKTVENDEENFQDLEMPANIPTLQQPTTRLDFDHSD